MASTTSSEASEDQLLEVVQLFLRARNSQRKNKHAKLVLGNKGGEDYFSYSVYPIKNNKQRKRARRKHNTVPAATEVVVEQTSGPSTTIPTTQRGPTTSSPPVTRASKKRKATAISPQMENTVSRTESTPEIVRGSASKSNQAKTQIQEDAVVVPTVPTSNRFLQLDELLNKDETLEEDTESEAEDNKSQTSFSSGMCNCSDRCDGNSILMPNRPIAGCWGCHCDCSCEKRYQTRDERIASNSKHECTQCMYYAEKRRNNSKKKKKSYSDIVKSPL